MLRANYETLSTDISIPPATHETSDILEKTIR